MSGAQFTLQPGVVSTLGPQLAGGTAIVNQDTGHAIWVSALASVQPGYGTRIGPMGSLVWSGTAPCYAVPDTGTTGPVTVNTSGDVTQLSNPVDVGVAVAGQLNALGVPALQFGEMVASVLVPGNPVPIAGSYTISDISKYANLSLTLVDQSTTQLWGITYQDSVTFDQVYKRFYIQSVVDSSGIQLDTTIRADECIISWAATTSAILINAFASNRVVTEGLTGATPSLVSQIPSQAWTANQQVIFPGTFVSRGGTFSFRLSSVAAMGAVKGFLGFYSIDSNNNKTFTVFSTSNNFTAGPSGEPEAFFTAVLPSGKLGFAWQNYNTAATYDIKLTAIAPY